MWYRFAKINIEDLIESEDLVASLIIFKKTDNGVEVLLEKRGSTPHKHDWTIPGGHVEKNESPAKAAVREIKEETNLVIDEDEIVLLKIDKYRKKKNKYNCIFVTEYKGSADYKAGSDAEELEWVNVELLPDLIWDNKKFIEKGFKKLYKKEM